LPEALTMRSPRLLMTVRRMMAGVAVLAAVIGGCRSYQCNHIAKESACYLEWAACYAEAARNAKRPGDRAEYLRWQQRMEYYARRPREAPWHVVWHFPCIHD
jgi:hypothetical protein